jgi:hypothetical protein
MAREHDDPFLALKFTISEGATAVTAACGTEREICAAAETGSGMRAVRGQPSSCCMATVRQETVQDGVIPDSGHWVMEENPNATIVLVRAFLTTLP